MTGVRPESQLTHFSLRGHSLVWPGDGEVERGEEEREKEAGARHAAGD